MKWILRRVSPWQDQSRFYQTGNPAVFCTSDKEEAEVKKTELELDELKSNPLPNFYEYWDVVRDKELIRLHNFLVEKHGFQILNFEGKIDERELEQDDVLHGVYADGRFSDADLLEVQEFVNIYYYKLDQVEEMDKYLLVAEPYTEVDLSELSFQLFDTEEEAAAAKELIPGNENISIEKT